MRPAVCVLSVLPVGLDLALQLRDSGGLLSPLRLILAHKGLEYRLRDSAGTFVLIEILHQLFQLRKAGDRGTQFLFTGGQQTVRLPVLDPCDLLGDALRVTVGKPCLFPDVHEDELGQHVLIDGMDGAGVPAAAGVIAADKGAVPARCAILIGEFLGVVTHLEATVGAVDKAGENALDAVRRGGFPYLLLVDADHRIPHLAGDDRLMRTFYPDPFFLRLIYQPAVLVGYGAGLALHHIPDVDLAADELLHRLVCPFAVDIAGIALSLALVVECSGGGDALLVERHGNRMKTEAGCPHCEDPAHDGHCFLVDDEVVLILRVSLVPIGGVCTHEFPVLGAGFFYSLDLLAGIAAIKFVK